MTQVDEKTADFRSFRCSLRALGREVALDLERGTDCCGVSSAQCRFLLEAEARPDASLTDLASLLSLDTSTLSRTADGLSAAGLILRETDPANRRKVAIRLTEAGSSRLDSFNDCCDLFYRRLLESIPAGKRPMVLEAVALLAEALDGQRAGTKP